MLSFVVDTDLSILSFSPLVAPNIFPIYLYLVKDDNMGGKGEITKECSDFSVGSCFAFAFSIKNYCVSGFGVFFWNHVNRSECQMVTRDKSTYVFAIWDGAKLTLCVCLDLSLRTIWSLHDMKEGRCSSSQAWNSWPFTWWLNRQVALFWSSMACSFPSNTTCPGDKFCNDLLSFVPPLWRLVIKTGERETKQIWN